MKRRRILAITGIRSDYSVQRPIFQAMMAHPELELALIVTGAHLSPLHGYTITTIEADGFPIAERIESLLYSDRDAARLKGAALALQVLGHVIDRERPDFLFAGGDREDPMLMALCGAYMNIPTVHYGAGDRVVGNVDDMVRHAISRLSHLLLTTHEEARLRLIKSGEQEWRVHNVGNASLDRFRQARKMDRRELAEALGVLDLSTPYIVVIQHPLSSEIELAGAHMRATLEAAEELDVRTFVSYPNSDAGSQAVIRVLEEYRGHPKFHLFRDIPDVPFINLLRNARALVGNSSLGLLEAPFLQLPVINVGRRQSERFHVENVVFVENDREKIVRQLRCILSNPESHIYSNPFGDGATGERIANLLATIPLDAALLNKDLSY